MSVQEERRVRPVDPDLDAEQEVDLGRYGRTVVERWWLPLLGLLAGALAGYLLSLGGGQVFRAQALVYLGQPLGILGGNPVQSLNNNPSTARAFVKSESVIRQVSRDVGIPAGELRRGVAANPVQGNNTRAGQAPLVNVIVKGKRPARTRAAANQLAAMLVGQLSTYAQTKIRTLTAQQQTDRAAIEALQARLADPKTSPTDKFLSQLELARYQQDLTQTTQLLAIARDVESPRIVTRAAAQETTARSQRNSIVVGALIGLLLGTLAALLWEPVVERRLARARG